MSIRANVPTLVFGTCLVLGILALLACADDPAAPESRPSVLTVEPTHQWAGGEVRITIVGFPFEDEDVIVARTDTLEVFDRQMFLLGVRLPTDANGPTPISVLRNGKTIGRVTAEAYGFEETRIYPDRLAHYITEFPVEWGVAVVGPAYSAGGDTQEGIAWIHLSTGMHRGFAGTPAPNLEGMYRTGVDRISGELYFELRSSGEENVHRGNIVGGQLVDLGWISRTCNRWGCEPLAGDIWVVHEYLYTCRLAAGPEPKSCEFIEHLNGDDPQWIRRLWSADVALIQHAAFRMSTGEFAYWLGAKEDFRHVQDHSKVTTDEGRGLFYVSGGGLSRDSVSGYRIHALDGRDGSRIRSSAVIEADSYHPVLGFDQARDIILVHRQDTGTVEVRDPLQFHLYGEIQLPGHPDGWMEALILVDDDTDRAFIVYSGAWKDTAPIAGTPVISIRLPPT